MSNRRKNMIIGLLFFSSFSLVYPQALWTPIYVDSKNQVDLWTQSAQGCRCSFDSQREDCACCVEEGGCPCGEEFPNRCGQCGIQQYCSSMCNMSLEARTLITKSGKSFGQIKSPVMEGPTFCWFSFIPEPNQRVEIQIYRLISVGTFNRTSCENGLVQLVDGLSPVPREDQTQICGKNERFTPPVLLFADKGPSTLIVKMDDVTIRSQIMAYFSFTQATNTIGPGFQPVGGRKLEGTDCDWVYKDRGCRSDGSCLLGSPGFPGVYQPYRKCLYYLATSSPFTSIQVDFKAVHLPFSHCETDFIKVYNGSSLSSPLVTNICGNRKQKIVSSNDLLIEFSSGPPVHPFDYNGFVAAVIFLNVTPPTVKTSETAAPTVQTLLPDENGDSSAPKTGPSSTITFYGNETRSGHFDSRSRQCRHNCSFFFVGKPNDILHLTLLNYHIRAPLCQTTIDIYDGLEEEDAVPMKHICSPFKKHYKESNGGTQLQDFFASAGNVMSLSLKRSQISQHSESEYVDGVFLFHDERLDGTLQPDTACDVSFYGHSSKSVGQIRNPGTQHLFWNSQSPLKCVQKFIPESNQSITLKIVSLSKLPLDNKCQTACGDGGCRCLPTEGTLHSVNHLIFYSENQDLSCLCGDFQQQWLPVGIRSWTPTSIIYSISHSLWNKGFHYQAEYTFHTDSLCGHQVLKQHSGQVSSASLEGGTQLNYFYYQSCTWALYSNVKRQLTVDIESDQSRPCTAWNITLHEYTEKNSDNTGKLYYTFCPRDKKKTYTLPQELYMIVLRLNAMTRILPSFSFKWNSQINRNNPHSSAAGITPAQSSATVISCTEVLIFLTVMLLV